MTFSVSMALAPLASVPIVQFPFEWSKLPWLAVVETKVRPAGSTSETVAFVAVSGPWLTTVMVKESGSPTSGRAWSTDLVISRSARVGVTEALAESLSVEVCGSTTAETEATFVTGAEVSTLARTVKVTESPDAMDPITQSPLEDV